MARYFRIVEIDGDDFVHATGEDLDCSQLVVPTSESVYAAVDESSEDGLVIALSIFSKEV